MPLTVTTPEDLLACVPICLGFVPEASVVMLSMPAGAGPHARVDLPPGADVAELAECLVRPAVQHRVGGVVLCLYTDLPDAPAVADQLLESFTTGGVEVIQLIAADGRCWLPMLPQQRGGPPREYDVHSHPLLVRAVVEGRVVLSSRRELEASVQSDPDAVRQVAEALQRVAPPDPEWVRETLDRHVQSGTTPAPAELARLVCSVLDPACRDAAWGWVRRDEARRHAELWLAVVRATPAPFLAAPAAVLALLAWLSGDGALAWCALDRARETGVRCTLADLVEDLLNGAVSPMQWRPVV